jgi:hypothetical protein
VQTEVPQAPRQLIKSLSKADQKVLLEGRTGQKEMLKSKNEGC